jgi:hypothetical protein
MYTVHYYYQGHPCNHTDLSLDEVLKKVNDALKLGATMVAVVNSEIMSAE